MTKFVPLFDRVLICEFDQEHAIEGILIPDSARQDMKAGVVIAVGEAKQVKEGDRVLFGPYAGMPIQIEGSPFLVMREEEIAGKVVVIR